ncbi:MAG: hypothetical protein IT204_15855 [Fimbriimonadaceae bacterium]|nr:hypothetical protein [Fimbriimonadaceae bacterium]
MPAAKSPWPWSRRELYDPAPPGPLTGRQLDEVAFPLGGLGTGCVSLGGWGQLRDWEIRNRPAKNFNLPQSFVMLRCRGAGVDVTKVLQGPVGGRYAVGGHSLGHDVGQGLPHFREVSFDGRFPVATVKLRDPAVPLTVELTAFNPFIPLDDVRSGLPVAILVYRLRNRTDQPLTATVYGNLTNLIGDPQQVQRVNEARQADGLTGLCLGTVQAPGDDPSLGTMCLATTVPGAVVVPRWRTQRWFSWLDHYWRATALAEEFPPDLGEQPDSDTGTLVATVAVPPRGSVEVPLLISWHFPRVGHWSKQERDGCDCTPSWLNWYATQWDDAWEVAQVTAAELPALRRETLRFRDTLFASTVPGSVLDAVSSQISILKSPTVMRLPDGTFYGFEGCSDGSGCCEGSCTHVWNYAQALPYLFPQLQRSMREADWANSLGDDGYVTFRMPLPLGTPAEPNFHPAADGQLGTILQTYREWLISGDTAWLRGIWPRCRAALEFAWKYWDADRDGVLEGMQHNTYDIEYYGPNTMLGSLYLGALRAAAAMARALDDPVAETYDELAARGAAATDAELFNGEYYEQRVEPEAWRAWPEPWQQRSIGTNGYDSVFPTWPKWQVGRGCLSDQLIGQWYAEMLGLGKLYQPEHLKSALLAIVRHNFKGDLSDHPNPMRIYAVGAEAGLILCTWPRGERPGDPTVYGDECWSGIEYQVAAHLIYEGLLDEGLAIVKAVRGRYTGERRNPWNEIECGHHYVRSMASYSLLLALSGFRWHGAAGHLTLTPRINAQDFAVFYSVGGSWGLLRQRLTARRLTVTVEPAAGSLTVQALTVAVPGADGEREVWVISGAARQAVTATVAAGSAEIRLPSPATATARRPLKVIVRR